LPFLHFFGNSVGDVLGASLAGASVSNATGVATGGAITLGAAVITVDGTSEGAVEKRFDGESDMTGAEVSITDTGAAVVGGTVVGAGVTTVVGATIGADVVTVPGDNVSSTVGAAIGVDVVTLPGGNVTPSKLEHPQVICSWTLALANAQSSGEINPFNPNINMDSHGASARACPGGSTTITSGNAMTALGSPPQR
jgi:hypothetical protein